MRQTSRIEYTTQSSLAAVSVPREFVIDPWSAPLAYLCQAVALGGQYRFNTEVQSGHFDSNHWRLCTDKGDFSARIVINCTGKAGRSKPSRK